MSRISNNYSTENEFIIKNKKIIVYLLGIISFSILIAFADYYVLPSSKANDVIDQYFVRTSGKSRQKVSYHYFTQRDLLFLRQKNILKKIILKLKLPYYLNP